VPENNLGINTVYTNKLNYCHVIYLFNLLQHLLKLFPIKAKYLIKYLKTGKETKKDSEPLIVNIKIIYCTEFIDIYTNLTWGEITIK